MAATISPGLLPKDEVEQLDPDLHKMWLEARDRHLGHLSAYSFDLTSGLPGVNARKPKPAAQALIWRDCRI